MLGENKKDFDRGRLEILLELAEASWRDFDARRPTEWRANLALWGGLGLFSGLVLKGEATVPEHLKILVTAILVGIGLVYPFGGHEACIAGTGKTGMTRIIFGIGSRMLGGSFS